MSAHYAETRYGFQWGSATVKRIAYIAERTTVVIGIKTPRADIQVYVTRTGKVRVFRGNRELKEVPNE